MDQTEHADPAGRRDGPLPRRVQAGRNDLTRSRGDPGSRVRAKRQGAKTPRYRGTPTVFVLIATLSLAREARRQNGQAQSYSTRPLSLGVLAPWRFYRRAIPGQSTLPPHQRAHPAEERADPVAHRRQPTVAI